MKIIITGILMVMSFFNYSYSIENTLKSMPNKEVLKNASLKSILPKKADLIHTDRQLKKKFGKKNRTVEITPGYCELVYIDGCEALYSYYNSTFSVTILAGYDYGLQAFYDYHGNLIDGTSNWNYATMDDGRLMMRHRYIDSKVYTDYDGQIVIFK